MTYNRICAVMLLTGTLAFGAETRPNIIIILTDDHGYADLGAYGLADDIRTPNLDRLVLGGALMTAGYVTAPQCSPSRAGIVTGRYQSRFGLEENADKPMSLEETTIAERMRDAGYATGFVGKWHLSPDHQTKKWIAENQATAGGEKPFLVKELMLPYRPVSRGFTDSFEGVTANYFISYDLKGNTINPPRPWANREEFRIDIQTDAALAFINRHGNEPFFLHLAYYAPHVPCEVTEKYFARFPGDMPERRRWALASIAAMDDGVGKIMALLEAKGLDENTLIFFFGDNGAPLKIEMADDPFDKPGWDGSLNGPMVGEKGMISDGGVRVPFFVHWKGTIPPQRYEEPVISLDAGATALALAGVQTAPGEIDGVNLMPFLTGSASGAPHDALYWRWGGQSAIREGQWKFFLLEDGTRMLFDMGSDEHENKNLINEYPEVAARLSGRLKAWRGELQPPGFARPFGGQEVVWYNHYFNVGSSTAVPQKMATGGLVGGWGGSGTCTVEPGDGTLVVRSTGNDPYTFVKGFKTVSGGPFTVQFRMKSDASGPGYIYPAHPPQADSRIPFNAQHDGEWHAVDVPVPGVTITGLRIDPATVKGVVEFDWIRLKNAAGERVEEWNF